MKKSLQTLALILSIILCLSVVFASCDKNDGEPQSTTASTTENNKSNNVVNGDSNNDNNGDNDNDGNSDNFDLNQNDNTEQDPMNGDMSMDPMAGGDPNTMNNDMNNMNIQETIQKIVKEMYKDRLGNIENKPGDEMKPLNNQHSYLIYVHLFQFSMF